MRTRRELLVMGGAGAAALTLPSFFPTAPAFAQGNGKGPDPILGEIVRQFQRMTAGLAANPPRGSAREGAATYRMLAAWGKANRLDAQIKQLITDAVEREGHHSLVSRLSGTDWPAELKRRGVSVPPNFRNPNYVEFAKGIAYVKAGFSMENEWKRRAWKIEKKAAQFDRMLAIRNGRQPDAVIRRIQDGDIDGDGIPDSIDGYDDRPPYHVEGDCTPNGDGSFSCNLVASATDPNTDANGEPGWCDDAELFMVLSTIALSVLGLFYALLWLAYLAAFDQAYFAYVLYLSGCL